jgi:HD-GYP domain-containing protein (c-di-GMP phosphodiesterase class II)
MRRTSKNERDLQNQVRVLTLALQERDEYTRCHCDRIVSISLELGIRCSLSARELRMLRIAAAVHDVGKVGIPDRVLLKPGRLDPAEWEIMQSHAERGQRLLMAIQHESIEPVAIVVRHHHEGFDGGGYLDGLAGEDIPILSRIIALADSYDAMATTRPYHRPRSHEEIMAILLEQQGHKYDPYLYARFAQKGFDSSILAVRRS